MNRNYFTGKVTAIEVLNETRRYFCHLPRVHQGFRRPLAQRWNRKCCALAIQQCPRRLRP